MESKQTAVAEQAPVAPEEVTPEKQVITVTQLTGLGIREAVSRFSVKEEIALKGFNFRVVTTADGVVGLVPVSMTGGEYKRIMGTRGKKALEALVPPKQEVVA